MKQTKHFRISVSKFDKKWRRFGIEYHNTNGYHWIDIDLWFWNIDIGESNY